MEELKVFPPSLIEQAIFIIKALDISADAPSPHEYGKLVANLAMLKINAGANIAEQRWEKLIEHLMYPDHNPFPHGLFLIPQDENRHYKLALEAIDEIFQKYGE